MAANHTAQVICRGICCGGKCNGEAVEVRYYETTLELAPCSILIAQGWPDDTAEVLPLSWGLDLTPAGRQPRAYRHADGLVTMVGAL